MPANGDRLTLGELEAFVFGKIEIVNLDNGYIMVINEMHDKEKKCPNVAATGIYRAVTGCKDTIRGHVVICKEIEVE